MADDTLAIDGGARAVTLDQEEANRWPILTEEDEQAVLRVIRDGQLSTHPVTRELEQDYCDYFGVRHGLSHCNGTAALLAAYFALDLKPGDEVIAPSATWWSTVLPMLWLAVVPVFADSEMERLGLDPADVEAKITPRTRAIVVVHCVLVEQRPACTGEARQRQQVLAALLDLRQGARAFRKVFCGPTAA